MHLPGDALAINDLWIVGDVFVNKNYYMLPQMKNEAKLARRQVPYIYDYFNVSCFTPNPDSIVRNVLSRFVNCVTKALNENVKLPRLILVISDGDIIQFVRKIADTDHVELFVDSALKWIINQMTRAIDTAKDNIQRHKPGAVLSYEPKIIWIKMMDKIVFVVNTKAKPGVSDLSSTEALKMHCQEERDIFLWTLTRP